MKIMKKVVLYVLASIFLGPFACLQISNTAECSSVGRIAVVVNFDLQQLSADGKYITFPRLKVTGTSVDSIKFVQISYSGADTTNAKITLPSMAGVTASADNTSTLVTFTIGSGANLQEYLRQVQYECETSQSITILLSSSEIPNDVHYFPGTGHFYKYVPKAGISWADAYKEALNSELGGWQGYLAVITSKEEDDFYKKYAATDGVVPEGWLGGTRFVLSNMGYPSAAVSSDNMGYYYWACGPESCFKPSDPNWTSPGLISKDSMPKGTYGAPDPTNSAFFNKIRYDGTASDVHLVYSYAPWNNKEPNNYSNIEGLLITIDSAGKFNDQSSNFTGAAGYTIEYGDRLWGNSTTLAGSVIVSTNITKQTTVTAPAQNSVFDPGATVTVSGTGAPGYIVTIVEGDKILATTQVDLDGYWSVQITGLPGGTHTVSIIQSDPYGNTFPAVPLSFKILKIPTADDFVCILPENLVYDGTPKIVTIVPKPGITGMGEITLIIYVDSKGNKSTNAPTNSGIYGIIFNVATGTDYSAATDLRAMFFP